jgi:hypothetical protein
MTREIPDPESFIDTYGLDAPVMAGNGMAMTLGQALEAERVLCPADMIDRQDPIKRVGYLARMLYQGGTLRPEDEYLVAEGEPE